MPLETIKKILNIFDRLGKMETCKDICQTYEELKKRFYEWAVTLTEDEQALVVTYTSYLEMVYLYALELAINEK